MLAFTPCSLGLTLHAYYHRITMCSFEISRDRVRVPRYCTCGQVQSVLDHVTKYYLCGDHYVMVLTASDFVSAIVCLALPGLQGAHRKGANRRCSSPSPLHSPPVLSMALFSHARCLTKHDYAITKDYTTSPQLLQIARRN